MPGGATSGRACEGLSYSLSWREFFNIQHGELPSDEMIYLHMVDGFVLRNFATRKLRTIVESVRGVRGAAARAEAYFLAMPSFKDFMRSYFILNVVDDDPKVKILDPLVNIYVSMLLAVEIQEAVDVILDAPYGVELEDIGRIGPVLQWFCAKSAWVSQELKRDTGTTDPEQLITWQQRWYSTMGDPEIAVTAVQELRAYTRRDREIAFLMSSHKRLAAGSPCYALGWEIHELIVEFWRKSEML